MSETTIKPPRGDVYREAPKDRTMNRRSILKGLLAAPMPAAAAQDYSNRTKGLPPLTIQDVKVITTSGGRN